MQALVTRPREESESLAAALAVRGIDAVIEPLIEVRCRAAPAPDLNGVQAILCTSASGVRALAGASRTRDIRLFAVGDATAGHALAAGFTAVESAGGDVADLARLAGRQLDPKDGRLLHVAGSVVAGDLAGALRAQGFIIERSVLYEAQPATGLSSAAVLALHSEAIGFALFFSPRTAATFVRLAGLAEVAECCAIITALSISPAVDTALGSLAWRERRVAERPNQPAMLDMLDRILDERGPRPNRKPHVGQT